MKSSEQLSILQVVPSINIGTGGPANSVPGLATALAARGLSSTVVSLDYSEYGKSNEGPGARFLYSTPTALGKLLRGWSPALRGLIDEVAQEASVIHSHALWMLPGVYARRAAMRIGVPLVISPRGMLDTWSLGHSWGKKRLAAKLYEDRNLRSARTPSCDKRSRSGIDPPL